MEDQQHGGGVHEGGQACVQQRAKHEDGRSRRSGEHQLPEGEWWRPSYRKCDEETQQDPRGIRRLERGRWGGGARVLRRIREPSAPPPHEGDAGDDDQDGEQHAVPVRLGVETHVVDLRLEITGDALSAAARIDRRESDAPHRRLLLDEHALDGLPTCIVDPGACVVAGLESPAHRILQHQQVCVTLLDRGVRRLDRRQRAPGTLLHGRGAFCLAGQIDRSGPGLAQPGERLEVGRAVARTRVDLAHDVVQLGAQHLPGACQRVERRRPEIVLQERARLDPAIRSVAGRGGHFRLQPRQRGRLRKGLGQLAELGSDLLGALAEICHRLG
jgi:hypothetical protein